MSDVDVTSTRDFEISLLLGDVKYHIAALYPKIGDAGKGYFLSNSEEQTVTVTYDYLEANGK